MNSIDEKTRTPIAFLAIFIAFAWIACAYILGAEAESMILNPVVPILLILLLLGFKGDDSVRRTVTITIAFISIWLFVRLQGVFMPFIIGFALAYVVYVTLAEIQKIPIPIWKGKKFHLPRRAAIAILVILLAGIMAFFALGIVPQLMSQGQGMKDGIVRFYTKIKDYTTDMMENIDKEDYPFKDRIPESWQPTVKDAIDKVSAYVQEKIPTAFTSAGETLGALLKRLSEGVLGTIGQVFGVFFILIVFVYAVESFQSHMEKLNKLIPENHRDAAARYAVEIDAGLCNAIPTVGPVLGGGIAVLATSVGFVAAPPGEYALSSFLIRLVFVLGVVVGIQLLDNSLISPKIMSSALDVHPLVVLFAVLLAANLMGLGGALLAIPGIVVCKAFIKVSGEMRAEREAQQA